MHKYSLKFHNLALENAYLEYQNKQQIDHMKTIFKINYPMLIILAIICGLKQDYVPLAISVAFFLNNLGFQKHIPLLDVRKAIMFYETQVFVTPATVLIFIYFSNHQKELGLAMIVCLMIQVQILVTTPNIVLAATQLLNNFVGVMIIIYIAFGWSLYIIIWIPLFLFSVYNYYNQKRTHKLQFQQSQVNQSIITLIKETTDDDILSFKLNKELLKYELEFTNIQNLDLSEFLSSIVIDGKQNIKEYLFCKINVNNRDSDHHTIIAYKNLKERIDLGIYIQYYPELRFYIKIIKKQLPQNVYPEQESKIMHSFYNKIISKAQYKPQGINFQYILKLLCQLNFQIRLQRILQTPYKYQRKIEQFNVLQVLSQCCKNLNIQFGLRDQQETNVSIDSHLIIFETLIYYLFILLQQKNDTIQLNMNREIKFIIIKLTFRNKINVRILQSKKHSKNIILLQNLLSNKPIVEYEHELICYIDFKQGMSFS